MMQPRSVPEMARSRSRVCSSSSSSSTSRGQARAGAALQDGLEGSLTLAGCAWSLWHGPSAGGPAGGPPRAWARQDIGGRRASGGSGRPKHLGGHVRKWGHGIQPEPRPGPRGAGRAVRVFPAAPEPAGIHRPGEGQGPPGDRPARRPAAPGGPGPRAAVRPPGPGQDHPGPRAGQRDGRRLQGDPGPRPGKEGRPGGDPHQPGGGGVPVHRRDPPDARRHRGDALLGHGGPQAGHPHRPGPLGPDPQGGPAALHPGGRHHPGRADLQAPARPVRHGPPPGVLHPGGTDHHRHPLAPRCWGWRWPPKAPRPSPGAAGARPGSSTACCAAAGTTPR